MLNDLLDDDMDFDVDYYNEASLGKQMKVYTFGARAGSDRLVRIDDAIHATNDYERSSANLCVTYYSIMKRTPKGAWLGGFHKPKFVLITKEFGRRFAYPTLEEAMKSYKIRKGWQKYHGEWAIKRAEVGMDMLKIYRKRLEYAKNGLGPDV